MSTTVYRGETDLENNNNVQKHTGKVKKFLQEWAFPLVCFCCCMDSCKGRVPDRHHPYGINVSNSALTVLLVQYESSILGE